MPDLGIRLEDRADGTWIIKEMSADEQQEVRRPSERALVAMCTHSVQACLAMYLEHLTHCLFVRPCRHAAVLLPGCPPRCRQGASNLAWPHHMRCLCVQIRDGEAAARAKEEKKQREAREAEQKRQSKDQEKLKKLEKEYAR